MDNKTKKGLKMIGMPAGKYYVGDLCYVMHDCWDDFCDNLHEGTHVINGKRICWFHTEYGDGGYYDQYGKEYSVDAGLIGCIKLDDITDDKYEQSRIELLGNIIEFESDFYCSKGDNGLLIFGHVKIETGWPEENEDNWGEYNDDEDEE